jgi:hypothetical protein
MIANRFLFKCLLLSLLFFAPTGKTDEKQCPDPRPSVLRGAYARTTLGTAFWLGDIGKNSKPGLAFGLSAGYEFFSWLSLESSWQMSIHQTMQASPPSPGTFNSQAFHLNARFNLPLRMFDLYARGGGGWIWSQPNILVRVGNFDTKAHFSWLGGLGVVLHTTRRHVWLGIEGDILGAGSFPGTLINTTATIGITF